MSQTFAVGEIVFHAGHGRGRILDTTEKDGRQTCRIAFNGLTSFIFSDFLAKDPGSASQRMSQARSALGQARSRVQPYPMTFVHDIDPNIHKEWSVEDWMGRGELLVPYGAPGCGKSVLIGDLVCHIGAGWDWFGKRTSRAAILYVAAERASLVERRFAAFRRHHGVEEEQPVAVIKGYFDLAKAKTDTDRVIATVEALSKATGIDDTIVVIDTKRQVIGDENSDDVGKLVSNLSRIQAATSSGLIVIDHSPFHTPTKPSGRGELVAAADATFLLERSGDIRTARMVKANDGPDDLDLAFSLTAVSLGTHPTTGKVTTAPVVVAADRPERADRGSGRLSPSEKIALSALEEAVIEAGEKRASGRVPNNARAVTITLWREYAYKRGITDSDSLDARKKAFQRVRQSLLAKKRIGTWGEDVWLAVVNADISGLMTTSGTRDIAGTSEGRVPEH